jgi:hypothetical protein
MTQRQGCDPMHRENPKTLKIDQKPDAQRALKTAEYFRRGRADFRAFDRLMTRKRGEKPRDGDEV